LDADFVPAISGCYFGGDLPKIRLQFMPPTSLEQIIPELRDAIGPVILISGVGLLLLTFTNRLGRAIDRARQLDAELPKRPEAERGPLRAQIAIIYRRAKLIRLSISLAALSALLAAALVVTLFLTALLRWENAWPVSLIFIVCMLSLIASLVAFIRDINLSLRALKLELEGVQEPKAGGAI
jgi:hypothetical protein